MLNNKTLETNRCKSKIDNTKLKMAETKQKTSLIHLKMVPIQSIYIFFS